jgi:hypothetical protein
MEVEDADPDPDTVAAQPAYGASNPPSGTERLNCSDEPDTVPETVPRPVTPDAESTIVNEPEKDAAD